MAFKTARLQSKMPFFAVLHTKKRQLTFLGEIFVLDMGSPVKIDTLARNLIKLSGYKPDVDIKIEYTGLRPGEKLYEEKLMAEEGLRKTDNDLIHVGNPIPFDTDVFLSQLKILMNSSYANQRCHY